MSEKALRRIGFGGGCHWCTEAVFLSLAGVSGVAQGFIASTGYQQFSEAVIVWYDAGKIDLKDLIRIHLLTHASTSDHSMRAKYRSAVYTFSMEQFCIAGIILNELQAMTNNPLVTRVYEFGEFKPSAREHTNYYYKNPEKPFCKVHIQPKIKSVIKEFPDSIDELKLYKYSLL